ncbi:MAG: substrate-binding domain-containing protein [Oscillospiraceae bacterium]|nr:substrate-binding domain-containing protein [Oscillospiraceae bacterium]
MKKFAFAALSLCLSAFTLFGCENSGQSGETLSGFASESESATESASETKTDGEGGEGGEGGEILSDAAKEYLRENFNDFRIDGSSSMLPLHEALRERFGKGEKYAAHSKTVDAFEKLLAGETDILLSVDFSDELLEKAENAGVRLVKKAITREAFVFLVNENNPVKSLTEGQIRDIYSGKITNWKDVGGDDAPISAFQRNRDSGSQIRMEKFMGDVTLTEEDVIYYNQMGAVIETVSDYDKGLYSIAYNMYTFTENQYANGENNVTMLAVNGVYPDDSSIFDETYPIVIYNYIFYADNNPRAAEFAKNLYAFLMSDEGQRLTGASGYVNVSIKYHRNDGVYFYDNEEWGNALPFYDPEKGEFYDAGENGELLVFYNYADYILRYNSGYRDDEKVREVITMLFDAGFERGFVPMIYGDDEIRLFRLFPVSFEYTDLFNFRYEGRYYGYLEYDIADDSFSLGSFDSGFSGYFADFPDYKDVVAAQGDLTLLTWDDLEEVYLRAFDYDEFNKYFDNKEDGGLVIKLDKNALDGLEYCQPFKF